MSLRLLVEAGAELLQPGQKGAGRNVADGIFISKHLNWDAGHFMSTDNVESFDAFEVATLVEHTGAAGRGVGVVRVRIPRAEHDLVETRERNEVLDARHVVVGALADADRAQLRE